MSKMLAIDPGPTESAFVLLSHDDRVEECGKVPNDSLRIALWQPRREHVTLVLEQIASYGMAVGAEVFETCVWSGRFIEAWSRGGYPWHRIPRKQVVMHLCGNARGNDSNVRQAIIDRYGGKEKAIGKKKTPGPLYGVSGDCWAALAVGLTWLDKNGS
jgi:hypothetical protein